MNPLIVIGGGEHARVVVEAARSRPDAWQVKGFLDPLPCEELVRRLGIPRLGDDDAGVKAATDAWLVLGVGAVGVGETRARIVSRYAGVRWATVIHAAAWVSPTARVDAGAVVMAGALIGTGAVIGEHCVVNTGAVVEHDCTLGNFAQLGPAAVLGGGVMVGEGSYLGLGCRVRDHIAVGARATVGMGAVVTSPVRDGATVMGVPARERDHA